MGSKSNTSMSPLFGYRREGPIRRETVIESTTIRPVLEDRKTPIAAIAISLAASTSTMAFASGVGGRAPAARKAASDDSRAFIDSLARNRRAITLDDIP